jgi:hypothetical protein
MIKKIALILLIFGTIVSCGKKGDPKYENSKKKEKIQTILINNA